MSPELGRAPRAAVVRGHDTSCKVKFSKPDHGCERSFASGGASASQDRCVQEDHPMNTAIDLPQVTIATHDYNRLMSVAALENKRRRPHREFLMSELRRASLCHPDALPDDVVST